MNPTGEGTLLFAHGCLAPSTFLTGRSVSSVVKLSSSRPCRTPKAKINAQTHRLGPFDNVRLVGCGTWQWGNRLLYGYDQSHDEELQAAFHAALDTSRGSKVLFDTGMF